MKLRDFIVAMLVCAALLCLVASATAALTLKIGVAISMFAGWVLFLAAALAVRGPQDPRRRL